MTWSILFFIAVIFISSFFGVDPSRSFWGTISRMDGIFFLLHCVAFYFLLGLIKSKAIWIWLLRVALFCGVYGAFFRISSNPHYIASYLLIIFFLGLALIKYDYRGYYDYCVELPEELKTAFYLLCCLIVFGGIYKLNSLESGSKATLLGLGIGLIVSFFAWLWDRNKKSCLIVLILILLGLGVVSADFPIIDKTISSYWHSFSFQERLLHWKFILKNTEHIGVGWDNFYRVSQVGLMDNVVSQNNPMFDKAHCMPLEVLACCGWLGLVSYLGMFLTALWTLTKTQNRVKFFLYGLLTANFIENLFWFQTPEAWIMLFFTFAFIRFLEFEESHEEVHRRFLGKLRNENT